MFKRVFFLFAILSFFVPTAVSAQNSKSRSKAKKSNLSKIAKAKETKPVLDEKEEFEKAIAETNFNEKVKSLQKFLADFPETTRKNEALEIIFSIRAYFADEKFQTGEIDEGIAIFKEALNETPEQVSDGLFTNAMMPFPNKLFTSGKNRGITDS